MRILIVGGGGEVRHLARSLCTGGHQVMVVDKDAEDCARLSADTRAVVVKGDGTIPRVLEEAGVAGTDRLLALTDRDEDNYVVCRLGKLRYGVSSVFALVHDPENEKLFREVGIEGTFSVTSVMSSLIEQRSASPAIRSLQPLADGRIAVTEIVLPDGAPSVRRPLRELRFPPDALVVAVLRGEAAIIPNGETVLEAGDKLSFVAGPDAYASALAVLVGNAP